VVVIYRGGLLGWNRCLVRRIIRYGKRIMDDGIF
jgi:hypothetical protein